MAEGSDFPYIPIGVVGNIFKRLYAKVILRFQFTCRDWYDLFKTRYFIDQHRTHSVQENPLLLLHSYDPHFKNHSLRVLNPHLGTVESLRIPHIDSFVRHGWTIVGSCNGLLCVELKNDDRDILLWNPAINEVREIPKIRNSYYSSRCCVGFGFSRVDNDYKIVRFYHKDFEFTKRDHAGVFSLNTGLWKELEGLNHIHVLVNGFNVNGTIFWLGLSHQFTPIMISFDIATEVFKLISLPAEDGIAVFYSRYGLGIYKNSEDGIAVFYSGYGLGVYKNKIVGHYATGEGPESHFVIVRELEEVASESGCSLGCTQRYTIGPIPNILCHECYWRNEAVFCDSFNGNPQVENDPRCVVLMANLNTNERRIFNCSVGFQYNRCDIFNYEESLVSVGNIQVE